MANLPEVLSSMQGDLKVIYSTIMTQTLPDSAPLQKRFPLNTSGDFPAVNGGEYYSGLTSVKFPWGFSFQGNGTEGVATNTALGPSLAGKTLPAKIYPCTTVMRDQISYVLLDRAAQAGAAAVMSSLKLMSKQMAINARNVAELQLLHGQEGLGAAGANISTLTVTFDPATTSPGILSALLGARVQFFESNLTTARTTHDDSNYLEVDEVDLSVAAAPTITLVATGTTGVANIVAGDVMFIGGSRGVSVTASDTNVPFFEQIGLGKQLALQSGSLFDISKTDYIGWRGNVLPTIGAFSPSALMQMAGLVLGRGGELGDYIAVVSTPSWAALNSALATNEYYNQQAPSFAMQKKTGTDEIEVKHAGITMEVLPHPFQKLGKCYLFPKDKFARVGSRDLTFAVPGKGEEEFLYPVANSSLMESQCRYDFQGFLSKPSSACVGTGISNV